MYQIAANYRPPEGCIGMQETFTYKSGNYMELIGFFLQYNDFFNFLISPLFPFLITESYAGEVDLTSGSVELHFLFLDCSLPMGRQ
jgi:hypothetical protein